MLYDRAHTSRLYDSRIQTPAHIECFANAAKSDKVSVAHARRSLIAVRIFSNANTVAVRVSVLLL